MLVDYGLDDALDFAVAKFCLCLSFELRLEHFDVNHGRQSLADVVAGEREILLLERASHLHHFVDCTGQRGAETGEVRSPFVRVDVVDEGERVLGVTVAVLHGDVDLHVVLGRDDADGLWVQRFAVAAEEGDEFGQAFLEQKGLFTRLFAPMVCDTQARPGVEICEFSEPIRECLEVVPRFREDFRIGFERDLGAGCFCLSEDFDGLCGCATRKGHVVLMTIAAHPNVEFFRQGGDYRNADAVESSGNLIGALVEFAAGVEHGHGDLEAGFLLGLVDIDRDTTAVVHNGDGVVRVDRQLDLRAETCQRFVDGVVYHLVHEMMQAPGGSRTDVHAWPLPNRIESFQYLNGIGVV